MKIKDICVGVTDGSHNPPQGIEISNYYMLSSKNIFDNEITFDDPRYLTESDFEQENKRTKIGIGDVLLTIVGTVGRTAVVDETMPCFTLQRSVAVLHPKAEICNSKYLMYALQGKRSYIESHAKGVAQKGIYLKEVSDIDLNVPSLSEQEDIVAVLDKVDSIIHARRQELQKLDELVKARFVELFGDPVLNPNGFVVCSLQELIDEGIITYHLDGNHGGDYPRSEEFVEDGVPYIGANSIRNGSVDFRMAKYLTEERAGRLRKGIARDGDVLFAHNATVGPVAVLETSKEKVVLSTSLTAFRCNRKNILPNYLKAYMQSDGFVRQYSSEMKQTTRNQVPITAQRKYLFMVAPMDLQKNFEKFAEQIDKSKSVVQAALDKTQTLFDSLMQKYFG